MAVRPRLRWAGKKTGPNPTDRGKIGTKRSLLVDARGVPLALAIEAANVHDMCLTGPTLDGLMDLPVPRPNPRRFVQGLCLDKGYDYDIVRELAELFGFVLHLRTRGEEQAARRKWGQKARRWVVERCHSWINRFRRLLIRWEKNDEHYFAMLQIACAFIALGQTGLLG